MTAAFAKVPQWHCGPSPPYPAIASAAKSLAAGRRKA